MTHADRGKRVAQLVRDRLWPANSRRPCPINLDWLAELVESECVGAAQDVIDAFNREQLAFAADREAS